MFSWKLFRRLTNYWAAIDNPVFAREIQREPLWQRFASRAAQSSGLLVLLTGVLCYLSMIVAYYAETLLVLFVPLVVAWILLQPDDGAGRRAGARGANLADAPHHRWRSTASY